MSQQRYTTYDRVLDWFSDNRQMIAKVMVIGAVAAMVGVTFLGALLSAF
ncbi:MAG: hypothetical protein ABI239_07665 [Aquihabitans sp.]